ncbi:hypothetical protein C4564_05740 [Candidatus Microgenomates bacterium]|nr:MAG: hypothetical protein C4564_05740 [Candidatus Microgenomates bacterium]
MEMENLTDKQLEDIVRKAENTHVSGSQFEKAQIELEIRRKRRLFEQQEKIFKTLQTRLDKIIQILTYINNKPFVAILSAGLGAIIVGVLINLASAYFQSLFGL